MGKSRSFISRNGKDTLLENQLSNRFLASTTGPNIFYATSINEIRKHQEKIILIEEAMYITFLMLYGWVIQKFLFLLHAFLEYPTGVTDS